MNTAKWLALGVVVGGGLVGCGDDTSAAGGGTPATGCEPAIGCPDVQSDCVAFADNAGKDKFALRITQLTVTAPTALTDPTVANLLSTGITYDYPACTSADSLAFFTKDGTFNWILEIDKTAGTLRTGGADLQTDPTKPYCFLNGTIAGFSVAPLETDLAFTGDSFAVVTPADVVVPIFTDPADATKVILLPLHGVRLYDSKVSADNNCIGSFNGANLSPNNLCLPSTDTPMFLDGGNLEGYITLEEADTVLVPQLGNASLCSLIAGADGTDQATKKCKRDAGMAITFAGDWCAGMPGEPGTAATATCKDAVKLAATYAAAGTSVAATCN